MKKTAITVMMVSGGLTAALIVLWIAGFLFAGAAVGNLIHLLLILAFITGFGFIVGAILFLISLFQKKSDDL